MKVITETITSSLFIKIPIKTTVVSSQSMEEPTQTSVKSRKAFMTIDTETTAPTYVTEIIQRVDVPSDETIHDEFGISFNK